MNYSTLMLQAGGPQAGGGFGSIILMVGMFVVLYFFMIRPQAKRAKEQKKFSDSITVGEQIVTTAGIYGIINRSNEDGTIQLEIARGTFIKIDRSAISMEMTQAARKKADNAASPVVAK
jgi:preprotein translocase subunit YajC